MGDSGIESYDHVPQQSRRDKLREHQSSAAADRSNFFPFYDPSLILNSNNNHNNNNNNNNPVFSQFLSHHHPFFDPQIQPSESNNNNNNPLLLNHCAAAAAVAAAAGVATYATAAPGCFKPSPLSLSLSSQPYNLLSNNGGKAASLVVPLGPFTGYASILKGSTFLKPAQQLLEDLCQAIQPSSSSSNSDSLSDSGIVHHHHHHHHHLPLPSVGDVAHKSTLVSMLDEVYRKYKQYYQQIQEVMTSFEYISGLGNAAPYANQAIKAMYKHFKYLKNAILDQLQFNKKTHGDYSQRSVQNSGFLDHQPVWRPQRGLPERAVTVLRAWLFEHFLHPYPSDTDKLMLAKQTGLSRSQVSNWFINARVRLWKPMVEEIYMLETKQTHKNLNREDRNTIQANDHHPSNSLVMDNPSTSAQQIQDTPPKRIRNELHHDIPMGHQDEHLNVSYNLSSHPHVGLNANMAGGNNGGVSLTLGLHQNNGIGAFSEPFPVGFPVASTRRFGLGIQANNDGYVMGGHFGRDVLGGQLLHDFVG